MGTFNAKRLKLAKHSTFLMKPQAENHKHVCMSQKVLSRSEPVWQAEAGISFAHEKTNRSFLKELWCQQFLISLQSPLSSECCLAYLFLVQIWSCWCGSPILLLCVVLLPCIFLWTDLSSMVCNINAVHIMGKSFTGKYGGDLISLWIFHCLRSKNKKIVRCGEDLGEVSVSKM